MTQRQPRALIPREDRAIHYFMAGDSKRLALVKAGYSENTARGSPQSVFDRPVVAKELARRQLALREKSKLTEEWVVKRFMMYADAGATLAKFKKVTDDGSLDWDFTGATQEELALINELTVTTTAGDGGDTMTRAKIGHSDPVVALNSLARVQGMFKDKVQFEGELSLVDRIIRGRERARIIDHDPGE